MKTDRPLSRRQAQIVNLAAAGHTDKEIAVITGVSVGTLRTYWDRLRHRYDARSRSEVIAKALIKPPVSDMAAYMLHKLPLFVWTATPDGRTDYRNEWFETHGGIAKDVQPGFGPRILMNDEEATKFGAIWIAARIRGEGCEALVHLHATPHGEPGLHKVRMIPIKNEDGIVVKWLGYAREMAEDADERMAKFLLAILKPAVPPQKPS